MTKVALCGAGKMGGEVARAVLADPELELAAVIDEDAKKAASFGVPSFSPGQLEQALAGADVCVDFTVAEAAAATVPKMAAAGKQVVVGTTGFSAEQKKAIADAVSKAGTAGMIAPNFSVGVNVFCKVAGEMAARLKGYDVEIIEAHHNEKKDSPSGTALRYAERIEKACGSKTPFSSVRAGDIIGEHTVLYAGPYERVELTHRAHSRAVFAEGALRAALWLYSQKPGFYDYSDLLGLKEFEQL